MIFPSRKEARRLTEQYSVVPVCKTILADTETPVSVWMKLCADARHSFLLESVTGSETVGRYSFIGSGPFMTFRANGDNWKIEGSRQEQGSGNALTALRDIFSRYNTAHLPGTPRLTAGAVGYCGYDSIRLWEDIPDSNPKDNCQDDIFFAFYRTVIAFDNKLHRLYLITNIFEEDGEFEKAYSQACETIRALEQRLEHRLASTAFSIENAGEVKSNFHREEFEKAVQRCKEYIRAGDIFQVVLSQRFSVEVEAHAFDLYRILRTLNPSPYMFFLNRGDFAVIGASPEMLARVENRNVETRPIAGTRPRGATEHEDEELAKELMADPKEVAEHVMLVDLGRNDVGRVSEYGSVVAEDMMHIEKFSHVMHLVTDVRGRLREDKDAFDALFSCFPAGTLSGAPKIRAMEIIDELEPIRRGLYGGALGYVDFSGNLDSCIVIRTIVYKDGLATVQAGAGIVADSVPSREYEETVNKAKALFAAIQNAASIVGK